MDEVIAQLMGHRGLRHRRGGWPTSSQTRSPPSRASTKTPPRSCRPAPATTSRRRPPSWTRKRRGFGVEDAVLEIDGVTLPIAVALGAGDVKTVEDLAGLVPDDIRGYFENKDGERVRQPGVLESFNMSPDDAEALIMRARVAMVLDRGARSRSPNTEAEEVEQTEEERVFGGGSVGPGPGHRRGRVAACFGTRRRGPPRLTNDDCRKLYPLVILRRRRSRRLEGTHTPWDAEERRDRERARHRLGRGHARGAADPVRRRPRGRRPRPVAQAAGPRHVGGGHPPGGGDRGAQGRFLAIGPRPS